MVGQARHFGHRGRASGAVEITASSLWVHPDEDRRALLRQRGGDEVTPGLLPISALFHLAHF